MDYWNELFTALDSKESWLIIFWQVAAAILGFLIGYFIRGRAIRRWRRRYKKLESEFSTLQTVQVELNEKLALQEADLKKAALEIENKDAQIRRYEQEIGQLRNDLAIFKDQYETLKSSYETTQSENKSYSEQIEELKQQLYDLKEEEGASSKGKDELEELQVLKDNFNITQQRLAHVEEKLSQLEEENAHLKDDLTSIQVLSTTAAGSTRAMITPKVLTEENGNNNLTLALIEEKLGALEDENIQLKQKLERLHILEPNATTGTPQRPVNERALHLENDEINIEEESDEELIEVLITPEEKAAKAKADFIAAAGGQIPPASPSEKDDLKKINGIGPFIEQKLNELAIFTYEQISLFDEPLTEKLTEAIQFFPGRIQRDDWVGQARALAQLKGKKSESSDESGHPIDSQDLKIVEGVGPKIEQILKEAGINDWKTLADTDVPRLREILETAGSEYRGHNPTTWPDQAKLAALGEWEKLEQFQSYLKGGENPKTDQ